MNRILTLLLVCFSLSLFATAEEVKLIEKTQEDDRIDRPRKPAKIWMTCDATDGILTFTPSDYYVTLYVTVENEDTGESWEGIITDGNMSMEYSILPGSYSITCVTEKNNIFKGYLNQGKL